MAAGDFPATFIVQAGSPQWTLCATSSTPNGRNVSGFPNSPRAICKSKSHYTFNQTRINPKRRCTKFVDVLRCLSGITKCKYLAN